MADPQITAVEPRSTSLEHFPETVLHTLLTGDISELQPAEAVAYYRALCEQAGLNWLSRPFRLIKDDKTGVTMPYADRGCAEQLRRLHRISVQTMSREVLPGADQLYAVTVKGTMPGGREEESQGVVSLTKQQWGDVPDTRSGAKQGATRRQPLEDDNGDPILVPLNGTAKANAMMAAESKAKRRVTLSLCGLGHLPEAETARQVMEMDPVTGEVVERGTLRRLPPRSQGEPVAAVNHGEVLFGERSSDGWDMPPGSDAEAEAEAAAERVAIRALAREVWDATQGSGSPKAQAFQKEILQVACGISSVECFDDIVPAVTEEALTVARHLMVAFPMEALPAEITSMKVLRQHMGVEAQAFWARNMKERGNGGDDGGGGE